MSDTHASESNLLVKKPCGECTQSQPLPSLLEPWTSKLDHNVGQCPHFRDEETAQGRVDQPEPEPRSPGKEANASSVYFWSEELPGLQQFIPSPTTLSSRDGHLSKWGRVRPLHPVRPQAVPAGNSYSTSFPFLWEKTGVFPFLTSPFTVIDGDREGPRL